MCGPGVFVVPSAWYNDLLTRPATRGWQASPLAHNVADDEFS
jgi:hypothetical protein